MPPGTRVQAEEGASAGARGQVRERLLGRSGRAGVGGGHGGWVGAGWLKSRVARCAGGLSLFQVRWEGFGGFSAAQR